MTRHITIDGSVEIGVWEPPAETGSNSTVAQDNMFSTDMSEFFYAPVKMNETLTVDKRSTFTQLDGAS